MTGSPQKSCVTCPSYATKDALDVFRKSTGSPMCARFGHVLGKPESTPAQQDKLLKHFASNCEGYGQPRPGSPIDYRMEVVMPDLDARSQVVPDTERNMVTSCTMCANYVRDDAVAGELGWTTGLCAAKGKLILSNRTVYEARNCEFRRFGQVRQSTMGLFLLPEYDAAFSNSGDPIRSYFKSKENFVDPQDWITEREVTEEERAGGIRAWRRIIDPSGSEREVFLPIYERSFFSEEDQKLIPQTDDPEHPELYVDHFGGVYLAAVCWSELDETPALWGEAGTGKTELFRHLAWLMQLPFRRLSITASTELDELFGKMHYSPEKGTYFVYGRLPEAWQKPGVICLDEPNVGPVDVWQAIRPLTDNSKQLVLDMNESEVINRHVDSYLGMAMNPAWDVKNVGAGQIGDADVNRLFHVYVDLPPESLEREIIKNRVKLDGWELSIEQLDMVINIAKDLRELSREGTLPISWAIRPQIKVARALRWFEPITAYRRAVGDYLEPEAQQVLLDQVRAHLDQ